MLMKFVWFKLLKYKFGDDYMQYWLVVGSRDFNDYALLATTLNKMRNGSDDICIVSGGAKGADSLAKQYALNQHLAYVEFPARWDVYGKSAGYRRNVEMHKYIAQYDDRKVIAFWDGKSKGTQHNFGLAEKYNTELKIINYAN